MPKTMIDKLNEGIKQFGPVEDAFQEELTANHKVIDVKKNEVLIRYNTISKDVYLILEGSFICSQISESGSTQAIWFHFEDFFDSVATLDSFYMDEHTKYEIKAMEDSKVVKISKQNLDRWIETYHAFSQFFLRNIIQDFVIIYEARSCLLTYNSLEFLRYTKRKFPFLFERLPAYYIAEFMGITPEWYSKLQKKLND